MGSGQKNVKGEEFLSKCCAWSLLSDKTYAGIGGQFTNIRVFQGRVGFLWEGHL